MARAYHLLMKSRNNKTQDKNSRYIGREKYIHSMRVQIVELRLIEESHESPKGTNIAQLTDLLAGVLMLFYFSL